MKSRYVQSINSETFEFRARDEAPGQSLVELIVLTSEICGHTLSFAAAKLLAADLAGFDETQLCKALARCRMEVKSVLTVADIIARIEDGRPGSDEAWEMLPKDELVSVVWTEEMAFAWGIAFPLLDSGNIVAARSAFDENYMKAVVEARMRQEPVRWTPSLGSDVGRRESVLLEAVKSGRLSAAHVQRLLAPLEETPLPAEESVACLNIRNLH